MPTNHNDVLEKKVKRALEICWNETAKNNSGPTTYAFLASSFAADGRILFEHELKMIGDWLRDGININLYGRFAVTTYTSNKGFMVAFQPVADLEDIVEMEL
ncbi:hypothetical protein pEaSNUABM17_00300 [Erwinia phage pEa_SNUABM_17]|uniref:Uncharacterized protein n=1 Tax=Erwinia phage pEa_SNUABM_17 TaxID=2869545 RepID=A0AAE7XK46_9CAUD|nr:hypothetical protein MPK72_gp300 [Erwinia phage pEa_SNUABM_17]QZE57846.1 hypothetical protein pEaSNUABM17_00300 [Erwinia phage pEa_SNUABM_17]